MSEGQTRNLCFTWNNYTSANIDCLKAWKAITFANIGHEIGKNGTPHLQGYIEFKACVNWATIHKKMRGAHVETRRGSAADASNYCSKGEQSHDEWKELGAKHPNYGKNANVVTWGEMTQQGKRNDLSPACDMIVAGKRMRDVAEEHPVMFVKYHKGLQALQNILIVPRDEIPEIVVWIGPSGSGKSRAAREWLPAPRYIWHPQCGTWFDGYQGEKNALFEEFRGQIPFGMLLSILDRYDCKLQYKCGMTEFCATKIAITSPKEPKLWYPNLLEDDNIEQLYRRIARIITL